jgi:hypothetical protein
MFLQITLTIMVSAVVGYGLYVVKYNGKKKWVL